MSAIGSAAASGSKPKKKGPGVRTPRLKQWRLDVIAEHGGPDGMSSGDWCRLRMAQKDLELVARLDALLPGIDLQTQEGRDLVKARGAANVRALRCVALLDASRPRKQKGAAMAELRKKIEEKLGHALP